MQVQSEQSRIAAQIDAEPRLKGYSYTLNTLPDGTLSARFYVSFDNYCRIIREAKSKPPIDCNVIYEIDESLE